MDTSEGTENHRSYQDSTHAEFRGGVFHGAINFASGGPKKRTEILEWISTVPYTNHHRRISDDRLAGTGEWILKKEKYDTWRVSTNSMLLLLRGIPGAGKTYIASYVIDWFLSNPTAGSNLAYFYCNRAEESRRDPESILRTLIQQLAQTPSSEDLLKPVLDVYKDRENKGQLSSRLTLKECQDLLVQLTAAYPQTTICVDALDEVDHKLRLELLEALRHVVERSTTVVKIFATTRMNIDILVQFEMFPRIELEPDDNVDDINRFVKETVQSKIERKQLLDGNVPNALKEEICQVLCERSAGMFQLAALQITLLCNMAIADDVRENLKVLPKTLTDAYGEMYNRIRNQSSRASQLALNAFRWVQCSYEPLQSETLLDAVTVEIDVSGKFSRKCTALRAADLLRVCQNLLILDECLNVFRFAHLSVEEYLETQQLKVDSHTEIAKICLSLVCSSRSWEDYDITHETREGHYHGRHLLLYSAVFWPWHLNLCNDSCQILAALWDSFTSEATFQHWIDYHCQRVRTANSGDTFWLRSRALQQGERDRFSTVCVFGLGRKIASIFKSQFGWTARIKLKFPATFISKSVQRDRINRLLLLACKFGDLDIAQHLLDAGAGISTADHDGISPLLRAAENRHEALTLLLVKRGADVSVADERGLTPLHHAVWGGYEALARTLLEHGADASATGEDGLTPLHTAVREGHEALTRMLLEHGANASAADEDGSTPLHDAVREGHEALTRLLVERGADVSAVGQYRSTPLLLAIENEYDALARMLLERGADVSVANTSGMTPLHLAARKGYEALARILLERGADVSTRSDEFTPFVVRGSRQRELFVKRGFLANSNYRSTPLHDAAKNGHESLALLLVEYGADVSAANECGLTPLHNAVWKGHEAVARMLLQHGADVSVADSAGWTPLLYAAGGGHEALAQLLVERGADVSAANKYGSTTLHDAAKNGHESLALLLVEYGANVSAADEHGLTPLHNAVQEGHEALVRLLLEHGADDSGAGGCPLLYNAVSEGHEALACMLLERGADVSAADEYGFALLYDAVLKGHETLARMVLGRGDECGFTLLHDAVLKGHEALARMLLERGADVSATALLGMTPLHFASMGGHEAVARMLLERGADVSAVDEYGLTPLHFAARDGHEAVAQMLLERGADVSAADKDGSTPLHQAAENGRETLVQLLAAAAAPSSYQ